MNKICRARLYVHLVNDFKHPSYGCKTTKEASDMACEYLDEIDIVECCDNSFLYQHYGIGLFLAHLSSNGVITHIEELPVSILGE